MMLITTVVHVNKHYIVCLTCYMLLSVLNVILAKRHVAFNIVSSEFNFILNVIRVIAPHEHCLIIILQQRRDSTDVGVT